MPFSSRAVANYFLELAEADGKSLDPMKIQKLVYFAHGWYLAITGKPLVDEHPEAWTYGPVFRSLYHTFKVYGSKPIEQPADVLSFDRNVRTGERPRFQRVVPTLDDSAEEADVEMAKQVIRRVWEVYGSWSAIQLSQLTHEDGGPWEVTVRENPGRKGTDISDERIREYFVTKAQHRRSTQHGA
jgi:uncharacterized phage-associated protein